MKDERCEVSSRAKELGSGEALNAKLKPRPNFKIARASRAPSPKILDPRPSPDHSRVSARLPALWLDDSKCMTLQSLQLRFCLRQFRFGHHLWRSQDARRFPIGGPLYGNEFALR